MKGMLNLKVKRLNFVKVFWRGPENGNFGQKREREMPPFISVKLVVRPQMILITD
jgi:hypothetical protein